VGGDAVDEGTSGHVVPIRDAGALAERMHDLMRDRERSWHMGRRGRKRVVQEFTWGHYEQRIRRVYDGLVNGPGG
jgi:glycosyltransferase involved in cell wall biosynthesis